MKKSNIIIIIILLAVAVIAAYLNRSYSYIYSNLDEIGPPQAAEYMTEKTLSEKSSLISYVAIGDSLTAGVGASSVSSTLPAVLAERIAADKGMPVKVRNLGVPGATSFDILTGQVLDAGKYDPEIITVFIGTNDMHNFVPIEKFKGNLLAAIAGLKNSTEAEIILINLPYLGANNLILPPYRYFFSRELAKFNVAIAEVAATAGVKLVDLNALSAKPLQSDPTLYSSDLFHPADSGYALWAEQIYAAIR